MKPNSTAKEQSLNPTTHSDLQPIPKANASEELDGRILGVLQAADNKKALDLVVLDLREIASFTDYFVIASGTNERQVQAISDEIFEKLKKAGAAAARVEGYKSAEWILLDYGDFIVHVFSDKARKFYDLERLWRESKRITLPPEFGGESNSSLRDES
ncbi:MAG: ribosome silencing factor [Acidobacteriota bacterium]|nr:ribosome silencing factor [Acidobacteriota bacterium]